MSTDVNKPNTTKTIKARARGAIYDARAHTLRDNRAEVEAMLQEARSITAHAVREILDERDVRMEHVSSYTLSGVKPNQPLIVATIELEGLTFRWGGSLNEVAAVARLHASEKIGRTPVSLSVYRECEDCGCSVYLGDIRDIVHLGTALELEHICPDCLQAEDEENDR